MNDVALPADSISILSRSVFTLNGLLLRSGELVARPLGQSVARWHVLGRINHQPRSVSQIARYIGVSRQNIQRIADSLVSEGLARYEPNPHDKRAPNLTLSPRGKEILSSLYDHDKRMSADFLADLDETEITDVAVRLEQISQVIAARLSVPYERA